jgi:UDP-3-O-[3-hydroxymyristoyl] N-acetylglucosamine deacetylase
MTTLQQTLKKRVSLRGIGLHSGMATRVTISPSARDTGLVFQARGGKIKVPALVDTVVDSTNATTLGVNGTRIRMVEHLMAALAGLGLDNAHVEVDGGEVPAADGSSEPFVALLRAAGRVTLEAWRRPLVVTHPLRVGDDSRWLEVVPSDAFRISYTLDHRHPAVGTQVMEYTPSEDGFVRDLAPARTYGFLHDVTALRDRGLALGGSLDNAIVIGEGGPLNPLRFRDEFVRHKVLDLVGDLALLGRPLIGHVSGRNGGHALNAELVSAIEREFKPRLLPARLAFTRRAGFVPAPA